MFVLVILGVAAVAKSVPVEPSKKVTDDATLMPKLQMAFLMEDVDQIAVESDSRVSASHIANILRVAGAKATPINRQGGYGRKRRSPQTEQNEVLTLVIAESQDDQIAVESESRVSALNIANILKVAGAEATPINRQGGYGRKRRSPQTEQNEVHTLVIAESQDDQIAVESESRFSALNIANILKVAGAEATPINRQGGYGRKRRSLMDSSSNDFDSLEITENLQSVSQRGGSDKQRKRSPQKEPAHSTAHQHGLVDNPEVVVKPHGKYGDLQKILALSGAKPQPISSGVSYGRRKKRSPEDLSNEIITNEIQTGAGLVKDVAIEAVKIKSHGNYGNIAQLYDAGANSKNVVVNGRYGRKKREGNFIRKKIFCPCP